MTHSCALYLPLIMPMKTSNFPKTFSDLKLNTWHSKQKQPFLPQADGWVGEWSGGNSVNCQKQTVSCHLKPWAHSSRCQSSSPKWYLVSVQAIC